MEKELFISYAWGGESENIVNEIDKTFQEKGITITRDKRDLGFKGMITDFMNQIGKGKAVIVVISDKYLKSPYCMYELLEIYRNLEFQERIFPIVLGDANIFEPIPRLQYLKHWQDKKKELDDAIVQFGTDAITVIGDDYKTYKKIFDNFGEIINILKDINSLTPQMHKDSGFSDMISGVQKILSGEFDNNTQNVTEETKTADNVKNMPEDTDPLDRKYKLPNISKLLNNAFNDTEFNEFCMFYFDQVHNAFSDGQSKQQKIMKLIDFCKRNLKFQYLLNNIEETNKAQFEANKPYF